MKFNGVPVLLNRDDAPQVKLGTLAEPFGKALREDYGKIGGERRPDSVHPDPSPHVIVMNLKLA
jgi:hypothetical protein